MRPDANLQSLLKNTLVKKLWQGDCAQVHCAARPAQDQSLFVVVGLQVPDVFQLANHGETEQPATSETGLVMALVGVQMRHVQLVTP